MIKLSEFGKSFVWTTKIDFPDSEDGTKNYLTLREPKQGELVNLSDDSSKNLSMLEKIFPKCVVESTFVNDKGEQATGEEILAVLKESGSMATEVLTTWMESIPFQHRLKKAEK